MDLILWRHAEAETSEPDLRRALTAKGREQAQRMADWLALHLPAQCKVLASPALRTQQTVQPLGRKVELLDQLGPGARPKDVLRAANWPNAREAVLIVGHQPTLGQVAALLLSGREDYWEIGKGNLWWFVQDAPHDRASLVLKAVLAPELLA